ncbi:unnamed protein product [Adineta ricciae]|uniref:Uncharacterized protein n=1 Tax=Adineta ricciae TaxID=249248 RepID=A0A815WJG6_ADIRI|nr:unnamed protein product [Adineta ricciae]
MDASFYMSLLSNMDPDDSTLIFSTNQLMTIMRIYGEYCVELYREGADPNYKVAVVSDILQNIIDSIVFAENVILNGVVRDTLSHMTHEVENLETLSQFSLKVKCLFRSDTALAQLLRPALLPQAQICDISHQTIDEAYEKAMENTRVIVVVSYNRKMMRYESFIQAIQETTTPVDSI